MIAGKRVMGPRQSICEWVRGEPRPPKWRPPGPDGDRPDTSSGTAFTSPYHCVD